ncbi:MAG: dynamin family protein, partial [Armatimonadota bacterium]
MTTDSVYFGRYDRSKESALELFVQCRKWVANTETICPNPGIINSIDDKIRRLSEDRFNLVVVGEFSSGKSFFINVLLDRIYRTQMKSGKYKVRGMLPDKVSPTTSTITIIRYGADESAKVTFRNNRTENVQLGELQEYVAESAHTDRYLDPKHGNSDSTAASIVRLVEISCNSAWLRNGIAVVDTPGTGSIHREHAEVTTSFIPQADAVLFMFSVQP